MGITSRWAKRECGTEVATVPLCGIMPWVLLADHSTSPRHKKRAVATSPWNPAGVTHRDGGIT